MRNEMKAVTQNELEYLELMIHIGVFPLKRGVKPLTEKSICRKTRSLEIKDFAEYQESKEGHFMSY